MSSWENLMFFYPNYVWMPQLLQKFDFTQCSSVDSCKANNTWWFLTHLIVFFQQLVVNVSSHGSLREKRDGIREEGGRGEGVVQGYARGKFHSRPWVMTSRNIRHFLVWKIWPSIFLRVATLDLPSFASLLWPSLICKEHRIIMQGIKNRKGDQSVIGQAIQQ